MRSFVLQNSSESMCVASVQSQHILGLIAPAGAEALPTVAANLSHPDPMVRYTAVTALESHDVTLIATFAEQIAEREDDESEVVAARATLLTNTINAHQQRTAP